MGRPEPLAAALDDSAEELYEHAPCGYLSTRPDGTILKVNQTFVDWTGHAREALVGTRRFQELLTMPGRIYHETHFAPLLRMQGRAHEIAFDLVKADGGQMPILVNAAQKTDPGGQPLLHRITAFNATDRRAYERELLRSRRLAEEAAAAKADLLSMISHDIRTPLSSIALAVQVLERGELLPAQHKLLRVVRSATGSLLDLTQQLLDASRIESGRLSLEQRPFDPRLLLQRLQENLAGKAEDKGLRLVAEVDPLLPERLVGDPVKITQILSNLLFNALKFTEAGRVGVRARVLANEGSTCTVQFAVSDTGIGIPPDRLAVIFEEFTQADYSIGLKFGGAGLGLSICRKLLNLHGSQMEVESTPGQGSTFRFSLDLEVAQP